MHTVAETPVFVRYAAEVWSDAERQEFINFIAANPEAGWHGVAADRLLEGEVRQFGCVVSRAVEEGG
jgi:hypothetical protein